MLRNVARRSTARVRVNAQISIYPLRQARLTPTIKAVTGALKQRHELHVEVGSMSTLVTGPTGILFAALADAFVGAAETGQVVMTVTVSNACPVPDRSR